MGFITIKELTKSFDGRNLFENFSLDIDFGEFVVIPGESGCGKTTLLNMIGGLEPVSSGSITADGMEITARKNLPDLWIGKTAGLLWIFCTGFMKRGRRLLW